MICCKNGNQAKTFLKNQVFRANYQVYIYIYIFITVIPGFSENKSDIGNDIPSISGDICRGT